MRECASALRLFAIFATDRATAVVYFVGQGEKSKIYVHRLQSLFVGPPSDVAQ